MGIDLSPDGMTMSGGIPGLEIRAGEEDDL